MQELHGGVHCCYFFPKYVPPCPSEVVPGEFYSTLSVVLLLHSVCTQKVSQSALTRDIFHRHPRVRDQCGVNDGVG